MRDSDVGGVGRIDAVGVARSLRGMDLHSPGSKAIRIAEADVKIRGVAQRDAVQSEVVAGVQDDKTGVVLVSSRARFVGKFPPGEGTAHDLLTATTVDY